VAGTVDAARVVAGGGAGDVAGAVAARVVAGDVVGRVAAKL
jgi:hypothetical protein